MKWECMKFVSDLNLSFFLAKIVDFFFFFCKLLLDFFDCFVKIFQELDLLNFSLE